MGLRKNLLTRGPQRSRRGILRGLRPYYAPNPLRGGASKGALKGRGADAGGESGKVENERTLLGFGRFNHV
jgi:hypothetical protein